LEEKGLGLKGLEPYYALNSIIGQMSAVAAAGDGTGTGPGGSEGCGQIIDAKFSFDGDMHFPGEAKLELLENGTRAKITGEYIYDTKGTYFVTVQVMSSRNETRDDIYTQIKNIDIMRVVVE